MGRRGRRGDLLMISVIISRLLDVIHIWRMRLMMDGFTHITIKQISTKWRQDSGFEMFYKDTVFSLLTWTGSNMPTNKPVDGHHIQPSKQSTSYNKPEIDYDPLR